MGNFCDLTGKCVTAKKKGKTEKCSKLHANTLIFVE